MSRPAIIVLTASAMPVASKLAKLTGGEVHGLAHRTSDYEVAFSSASAHLEQLFTEGRTIIAVMAAGAVIRLLASVLADKQNEPPVLAVSEDGASIVPLLGGHHGANQIARFLSEKMGGHAAITTAGDIRFSVALDDPPSGWTCANPKVVKNATSRLLAGEKVCLDDKEATAHWLRKSELPISGSGTVHIKVTTEAVRDGEGEALIYHPAVMAIGVGCERNADAGEVIGLVDKALVELGVSTAAISMICSIDVKADEHAVHRVASHFGVPARFFSAQRLEQERDRLKNPSNIVFEEVGCHGVAEGSALAAVGSQGKLVLEKQKSKRATVAVAQSPDILEPQMTGRSRGHLSVVGIGPGMSDWRSPEVSRLVCEASDLVGYSLYLDLLETLAEGKVRHDFDLGKEEDRVRHAMELAGEGKNVALVCSGDAGIYAMATLVFELLDTGNLSDGARRIGIQVSPGISALQAAAARAGAPLGHDFCTISLSDLLTPWEAIQKRVKAAAEGDFVIAFYNPVSRRRRTQLAYAKEVLLEHRPADTPVILATNLGREGETCRVVPLAELHIDDVDMLTVVIVGSSDSRVVKSGEGREWVYTPRGYAAKAGTMIGVS